MSFCSIEDAKLKRLGRPLKEKGDPSADLHRGRVRRAQKAFRQRKEQHMSALEGRVLDLENVVEEMANAFIDFSDSLLESGQFEQKLLKQTMERFLQLSRRASHGLDVESEGSGDEADARNPLEAASRSSEPPKMVLDSKLARSPERDLSGSSSVQLVSTRIAPRQGRHSFSGLRYSNSAEFGGPNPYGNHLWGIPPDSSTDGTSAIPYILAGRDSFASRLYFETLVLVVRALRGEVSSDILDSMYHYKRRYVSLDRILGVTTGVLNTLSHGTSQSSDEQRNTVDMDQSGAVDESTMKAAIVEDVVSRGDRETEYLNTWSVERYLGEKWGLTLDSNKVRTPPRALLEARPYSSSDGLNDIARPRALPNLPEKWIIFAPTRVPGFSHSEQSLLNAGSLVEKITMGAISLGEGPRWHISYIDGAVESFLRESNAWE